MMDGRDYSRPPHDYRPNPRFPRRPPPTRPPLPKFTVLLERPPRDPKPLSSRAVDDLIASLPSPPECPLVFPSRCGPFGEKNAAKLLFPARSDALEAVAFLWRRRLDGVHFLIPVIEPLRCDPSLKAEELQRVKQLLVEHVDSLLDSEIVNTCWKRAEEVEREIRKKSFLLTRPNKVNVLSAILEEKKRLDVELDQINGKLEEFRISMKSILDYLNKEKDRILKDGEFYVFKFGRDLDFRCLVRIHSMVMRECRRLSDGLPIYAWRKKILQTIFENQVTVVIGETGSGKSTQLVQFIADSGLASTESIVCTQPRKIAAISVAQRIGEESSGCYDDDNSVVSYPSYSSSQDFNSSIIFMTDHCLLQHYMGKKNFKGISCIIVDEAHERSLNTDLLLALIKKELLLQSELRVIIMSATADASKLADYFYGCPTICVKGRNFPVNIKYIPDVSTEAAWSRVPKLTSGKCASYVSDVVMMVSMIHKSEESGAILAFLTSQMEVEWACESFNDPSAVVLPMHGKLSHEDQSRVMQNYPRKRKVIFATNVAETSLTIQDVKYVVDSGMVKESRFEPSTGMNVLKVGRISQSSANQRTGRAGRTGPGNCYRLYSECDFQSMKMHQEPEIRKVHLGIAVLRILALDIKNVQDFDFVDAPDPKAVEKAVQNLTQLGAIVTKNVLEITDTGLQLVKLDIEPRLGKIILDSFGCGLRKEGLVLAAVMANSSSIFCRVGSEEDKHKADCLRLPFCHRDGDLFTLLSVYKKWEEVQESRNRWCWQNSINAKSLRRCQDTVLELEKCLRYELNAIVPSYWYWNPYKATEYDRLLKKIILSSLIENVAMYSGSEQLGYEVALSGQQLQLHPSCSLLVYGQKPSWVVFGEILSIESRYLVCVSSVDYDDLLKIQCPLFDVIQLERRKMSVNIITVVGNNLLRRFCGKSNSNLQSIISHIREECMDDRISINVDFVRREIQMIATAKDMEKVSCIVKSHLESEKRWLRDECIERNLFHGGPVTPPSVALFGSGAAIKHLELEKRCLTVEIFHPNAPELNEKELLMMVEQYVPGVASFFKHSGTGLEGAGSNKWGRITFLCPESAENAVAKLNEVEFYGSLLKVLPVRAGDHKTLPCSAVRAKVCWPRRRSKGVALIQCAEGDAESIARECFALAIGGKYVNCEVSLKCRDCVFVSGIPKDVSESEIYEEFVSMTTRRILGIKLLKYDGIISAPEATCAEALTRELAPFMPNKNCTNQHFQVEVFSPEPKDHVVKAMITFNGSFHLEAAKALDHLEGKVLPGCLPWQKIQCQHVFYSTVSCPGRIYAVIRDELDSLLKTFKSRTGVTCALERTITGTYRVKVSANATKVVADLRKPLEQLTRGKTVSHPGLTPSVLIFLVTRDGIQLLRSLERETGTYILYDRQNLNVRIFGSPRSVTNAEWKLVRLLLACHENKPLEIRLRGHNLPPDLMKVVVQRFGTDLQGLKENVPGGVELSLNTRRHILFVRGTNEQKQKTQEVVSEVALSLGVSLRSEALLSSLSSECPICLCEIEEPYKLEGCGHDFCRPCLVEQCESVARSHEGFPLCCTKAGCGQPFLLVDIKSLLPSDKLEELFRAALGAFVGTSEGRYRFCPSPDCPAIYRVADKDAQGAVEPFVCGACSAETCTRCHLEYHPFISCERYREFKDAPDKSLMEWRKGKGHVRDCPSCGYTIEKVDGCNHVECRCGKHICWVCLESFSSSDECYSHLRDDDHV